MYGEPARLNVEGGCGARSGATDVLGDQMCSVFCCRKKMDPIAFCKEESGLDVK
jgi:hypothetical protein